MSQASLSNLSLRAQLSTHTRAYVRGGAVLVVLIIAASWVIWARVGRASSTVVPTSPAIEAKWGVRVTQIGVTADAGMVDFRFIVLDPDKALTMMQTVGNLPVLVAEDSGTVINSTVDMAVKHDLNAGQTYFLLYRNTEGAIRHGTSVTVRFGNLELQHVIAK
jgi:hypothetical protein